MSAIPKWRLGCQAYTFRHFTFVEASAMNAALGLEWIEAYPGQMLQPEYPGMKLNHWLPEEQCDALKAKLAAAGVTLVTYGVVAMPDEKERRQVFEFVKRMGIETIVAEPPLDSLGLLDDMCQEYAVRIAIHNHPDPSLYWNPQTVLDACAGRSHRIGACADTGHWVRSGVDPLEALKRLEGRIVSLHIKDVDRRAASAADVPWGAGVGEVRALLEELYRQRVEAVFSIEYEGETSDDPSPDLKKCVAFFNEVCRDLENA